MKRLAFSLLYLLASCGGHRLAFAEELPEPGVRFSALVGTEVTMTADTTPGITPTAEIEVDGPLAIGKGAPLRVYSRLRTYALPGETLDLASIETFRAAEFELGAYKRVGRLVVGDQELWTSIEASWGFATSIPTSEGFKPALRAPRHYAVGTRIEERKTGAWLSWLYGRDESAGPRQWGQWILAGAVPLAKTKGAAVIGGEAVLSVGPPGQQAIAGQRDRLKVWVAISLPELAGLFDR